MSEVANERGNILLKEGELEEIDGMNSYEWCNLHLLWNMVDRNHKAEKCFEVALSVVSDDGYITLMKAFYMVLKRLAE